MKLLPLTQGQFATVDDSDYALVSRFKWSAWKHRRTYYAVRTICVHRKQQRVAMHRLIMGTPKCLVDHINGNGLDNRRSNLRLATDSQNKWNMGKSSKGSTQYKGVHWRPRLKKFTCQISVNNRTRYLGLFQTAIAAALAYDKAAVVLRGEFARINFPALSTAPTTEI